MVRLRPVPKRQEELFGESLEVQVVHFKRRPKQGLLFD